VSKEGPTDRRVCGRLPTCGSPEHLREDPAVVSMKLELVPVPVSDVDRAKAFYVGKLGFHEDVDVRPAEGVRVVQLTPPGSACSIGIGTGLAAYDDATPGSVRALHLVVADIEAARAELRAGGVEVGDIEDVGGGVRYAGLSDPDGNSLVLQEMPWRTGDAF
jgi:catechol 2,3-dioxygenase-like lactoylglutathione lyase family enzyme